MFRMYWGCTIVLFQLNFSQVMFVFGSSYFVVDSILHDKK